MSTLLSRLLAADTFMPLETAEDRRELLRLQSVGCVFEEFPHRGVKLIRSVSTVWADAIEAMLPPGHTVKVYEATTSTQDVCRNSTADALTVVADQQTGGRGRLGREWVSPPGACLTFSHRRHIRGRDSVERANLAACVALADAIAEQVGGCEAPVTIKWPNDIELGGKKVAGILTECFDRESMIIGIGVNVGLTLAQVPLELRSRVTSLAMTDRPVDRLLVLVGILRHLFTAMDQHETDDLLLAWRHRCRQFGQTIHVACNGREVVGTVVDLDPVEGLIVRTDGGAITHFPAATSTVLTG